jgi:hypothetical protein
MTFNDSLVTVTLSDCSEHDALCVLHQLGAHAPELSTVHAPSARAGARTTVWASEVVADPVPAAPAMGADRLDGPLTLTAQGSPHNVMTLRSTLARAYRVEDAGSVSGDQECDCLFRLTAV